MYSAKTIKRYIRKQKQPQAYVAFLRESGYQLCPHGELQPLHRFSNLKHKVTLEEEWYNAEKLPICARATLQFWKTVGDSNRTNILLRGIPSSIQQGIPCGKVPIYNHIVASEYFWLLCGISQVFGCNFALRRLQLTRCSCSLGCKR